MMMHDAAHEILRDCDAVRDRALARIDAFLTGLKG
jgi:alpha-beta hydrolase superfamily lysophospholipase